MRQSTKPTFELLVSLLLLLMPSVLHAWGKEGHEIIAMIAQQRLQPEVRDAVTALLGGTTFVKVATWADEARTQQTAAWHYVNIDLEDSEYDAARVCPQDQCVIGQIERFRRELTNTEFDFKRRQKALKYLIHLVGDLHQPLHAGHKNDHGGNDVQVEFLGKTINPYKAKSWNLHAVWDSAIVEERERDAQLYAERLSLWLDSQPADLFQAGSVIDWAIESKEVARQHVYVFPEDRKLGEEYYQANTTVVDRQLVKAGVRLATLLNDALAQK